MASKVLIKMPTVSFSSSQQQVVNTKGPELVAVGHATTGPPDGTSATSLVLPTMSTDPLLRISQLEQNIRFLHDQHQHMLGSLHNEIEMLRQRNRDLQFQVVFTKKNAIYGQQTSSESSPDEESAKSKALPISPNPKCNTQNLQVEMLEKDLTDLKSSLNELSDKNTNLTKVLNEQSELLDKAISKEGDYELRLDDADKLIKRLQQENDDQRKEISMLKAQLSEKDSTGVNRPNSGGGSKRTSNSGGSGGGAGGSGRDRTNGNSGSRESGSSGVMMQHQDGARHHQQPQQGHQRFPPLHSQLQYRQRSPRQQNSENPGGRPQTGSSMNRSNGESSVLPHLQQQQQQQQRHYNNYNGNNSGQQNKPNRYYNNGGGARHYNHNQPHYYYSGYKNGNGRAGNNSRDQQPDNKHNRQQYEQHKPMGPDEEEEH